MPSDPHYDVVIASGGNAALCAALVASRAGAGVLILEAAPMHMRAGNSRHTRNVRYMHEGPEHNLVGSYGEEEFFQDLLQVTGGETNEALARLTIRASADLGSWILGNGVRWQGPLKGTLQLSRTNAFFLGGGKALVNAYYQEAERLGVDVRYETEVCDFVPADGGTKVEFTAHGETWPVMAKSVVVASGGFEANLEWLARNWGEAAPKRGAAWLARRAGVPLVPIAIAGTEKVMGRGAHRIRRAPVRVVVCEPIRPADYAAEEDPLGVMTAEWHRRVDAALRET